MGELFIFKDYIMTFLENNKHIHFNTFYRLVWDIVSTKNEPSYIMYLITSKLFKSSKLTNDHKFKRNIDLGVTIWYNNKY